MWVQDKFGNFRDIVLGFDNKTNYGTDLAHPYFGPVVGRYANRIEVSLLQSGGACEISLRLNPTLLLERHVRAQWNDLPHAPQREQRRHAARRYSRLRPLPLEDCGSQLLLGPIHAL